MKSEILFEEVQAFATRQVQQAVQALTGFLFFGSLFSLFMPSLQQREITISLLALAVFGVILSLAFSKTKLVTQVRTDGIYVIFPPLQPRATVCRWNSIDKLLIRTYNPLVEFGGWGIRFRGQNKAYSTSGTTGLQIIFKDGSGLLIGTQQPEALRQALKQINKYHHFQV